MTNRALFQELFDALYDIGTDEKGGVTRLGYSKTEDEMHAVLSQKAAELQFQTCVDGVGNLWIDNGFEGPYTIIGSHLDSVVNGGRYDGAAGVLSGLLIMDELRRKGCCLPIKTAAFRCEESSNFRHATLGSSLITQCTDTHSFQDLKSRDGKILAEIFREKGYSLQPKPVENACRYIELHIEQGKVLEESGNDIGIVTTIAAPHRFEMRIKGIAEHSGATPMSMRNDALTAAAEVILKVEETGRAESVHGSVATVGIIENHPNVMNVIPGETKLGIDLRGIDETSIERMETSLSAFVKDIENRRNIVCSLKRLSLDTPVPMDRSLQEKLYHAAQKLSCSVIKMPSGAGHDAMSFVKICPTAMVFVPCRKGISHNPEEFAEVEQICKGADVIAHCLMEEAYAED